MGDLLNHLDFWLMVVTLGACGYFLLWKDRIQPIVRGLFPPAPDETPAPPSARRPRSRVRSRPIRGPLGQFAGSRSVVPVVPLIGNDAEPRSNNRSASESAVPTVPAGNDVPIVPVSVPEIVQITAQLMCGVAASDVAKTLPGYTARNYQAYVTRVRAVKAELDQVGQGAAQEVEQTR